ncbi:LuxR C-terminal-related transcriptional regulator [Streptomyces olivaceus]|uniref:LuxR C-terminal-related transcriptional regulator n=1 Tax=Streptomyces olivaceus TaxID=47716 RepID=UPI001CCEA9AE|nr:LuxR C-terminal-related transcriptional regulator [Streptomyces olivaceus]
MEELTRHAPLAIALDDVGQATAASLVRLQLAVQDVAHLPVVLVASTRSGEPAAAPVELAELLSGASNTILLGLSERETGDLLFERLRRRFDTDFVKTCHRITLGNPFLINAVCDWIRIQTSPAPTPTQLRKVVLPSVVEAMTGSANRLDPRVRSVAESIAVAAVSGEADPALLASISRNSLEDTLATLDFMVRTRLTADDHTVALKHPLLASALLGSMTVMGRNAAHLAAATFEHKRRDTELRAARHLAASTVPLHARWSVTTLIEAARSNDATARDRVRFLEHAAQIGVEDTWPRVAPELAQAQITLNRDRGLRSAVEMLGGITDAAVTRRLLALIGSTLYEDNWHNGQSNVIEAVRTAVAGTEFHHWPQEFQAYGRVPSPTPMDVSHSGGASSSPVSSDVRLHAVATSLNALSTLLQGKAPATALADARKALDCGLEELLLHPIALPTALSVLVYGGHHTEASARLRMLVASTDHLPRWVRVAVEFIEATRYYAEGELYAARRVLAAQLADLSRYGGQGYGRLRTCIVGLLANVHLDIGDTAAAAALLRRHHHEGPPGEWYDLDAQLARARLQVNAANVTGGVEKLLEIVRHRETTGGSWPGTLCWRNEGVPLLAKVGAQEQAVREARRQTNFADKTGSTLERSRALRIQGVLSQGDTAVKRLTMAADLLAGTDNDLELARICGALGTVLARLGRHDEAVAALTRSGRLAAQRGARDLEDRVHVQLVSLESRLTQDISVRGILSLTPREREILIDAVLGQANNIIAGHRRITRRTVELHLSSAYRKLGISGRDEFGKILGSPGRWEILTAGPKRRHHRSARCAEPFGDVP